MLNTDIAISAGGQTLYELAYLGVPTIAIVESDNQKNNVNAWKTSGCMEGIEITNVNKALDLLSDKIKMYLNFEKRNVMSLSMKEIMQGNGIDNLYNEIIKIYNGRR